jgi:hypothetical protein
MLSSKLPLTVDLAIMSNQLDLSQFTTTQLINLLWELKGTPQAGMVNPSLVTTEREKLS